MSRRSTTTRGEAGRSSRSTVSIRFAARSWIRDPTPTWARSITTASTSRCATIGRNEERLTAAPTGLRDRGRARVPRDSAWCPWLRAGRALRLRAHRPDRADRRYGRTGTAHRLDVQGRLARAPERVRVHERPAARGQSAATGREARAVRGRGRPEIRELRFYTPATPAWSRRPTTSVARLPQAGTRLARDRLFGSVDVRVRVSDPQSFVGWFVELPGLPRRIIRSDSPFGSSISARAGWFAAARPSGRSRCSTSPRAVISHPDGADLRPGLYAPACVHPL